MKKWLCLLIALCLCTPALAETNAGGAVKLETNEVYLLDLDGDGRQEKVQTHMQGMEYEENLELLVETDELVYTYETFILFSEAVYAVDLDGDGKLELLLSGDEASEDFATWCLKFDRELGLQPLPFADANRGENTDEYFDYGYGRIDAIDGATLTLSGSQDALGTWWCSRQYTLRDGRFELDDDGIWHVVEDFTDPDIWEYHSLKLIRELEVALEDGTAATLPVGEVMLITGTDKKTFADFQTKAGQRGRISIAPDREEGWGFLVNGINENNYFDYVPYAD